MIINNDSINNNQGSDWANPTWNGPENDTQSTNEQDLSSEQLVKQLTEQNQTQSQNLINQRTLLDDATLKSKKLEEEVLSLRKQNEMLLNQQAQTSNQLPQEYLEELNSMKKSLNSLQEEKMKQQRLPIIDMLKNHGITSLENIQACLAEIKQEYGVDLWNNPNPKTLEVVMSASDTSEPNLKQGYYSPYENGGASVEDMQERAYQERLAAEKAKIYNNNNKK